MMQRLFRLSLLCAFFSLGIFSNCKGNSNQSTDTIRQTDKQTKSTPDKPVLDPRATMSLAEIEPGPALPASDQTASPLDNRRAINLLKKADRLRNQQRYTEATQTIEQALRMQPGHHEILFALASAHFEAGNLERARRHVRQALEAHPTHIQSHILLGDIQLAFREQLDAMQEYRIALLLKPNNRQENAAIFTTRNKLASLLHDLGYYTASIEQVNQIQSEIDQGIQIIPDEQEALNRKILLADNYEKLGKFNQAADTFKLVIEADRQNDAYVAKYTELLFRAGDIQQAMTFARNLSINNESIELLRAIYSKQDSKKYLDILRDKMKSPQNDEEFLLLARELMTVEPDDSTTQLVEQRIQEQPGQTELYDLLFNAYAVKKEWYKLYRLTSKIIAAQPEKAEEVSEQFMAMVKSAGDTFTWPEPDVLIASPGDIYLHARHLKATGKKEQAIRLLQSAIDQSRVFVPVRIMLSQLYLDAYQYDNAIKVAQRTSPEEVDDLSLEYILGQCHYALDNVPDTEKHLRATLRDERFTAGARLLLGKIYSLTSKHNKAQRQLTALLKIQPDQEVAVEILAGTYLDRGMFSETVDLYEQLEKNTKSANTKVRCRAILEQFNRPNPERYRQAILDHMNDHEPDATAWIVVADSYDSINADKKVDAYEKALELEPDNTRILRGLARAYQGQLDFEKSVETWKKLLTIHPNRHSWYLAPDGLIAMHQVLEQYPKVYTIVEQQTSRKDLDETRIRQYRESQISTLLFSGKEQDAINLVSSWLEKDKDNYHWKRWLAGLFMQYEKFEQAIPLLDNIVENNPSNVSTFELLLEALIKTEQTEQAMQLVLSRLYEDPASDDVTRLYAFVLEQAKQYDQAIEIVKNKLEVTNNQLFFEDMLVTLYSRQGEYESAIELLENYISKYNRNRQDEPIVQAFRDRIIEQLFLDEDYEEADRRLRFWLSMPADSTTYNRWIQRLSFCQDMLGKYDESTSLKEQYLSTAPDDVIMNNDLAYNLINRGVQLDRAEPLIRYALSQAPMQSAYLDTYGWLKYKQNKMKEAALWLGRAHRMQLTKDAVIADHYADALWRLGRKDEALRLWKEAESLVSKSEFRVPSRDEVYVINTTPRKIKAAESQGNPPIAPLAEKEKAESKKPAE